MFDDIVNIVKDSYKEKLDTVFNEFQKEYEWYCVTQSKEQKKRHAENMQDLAFKLSNIAEVLRLLE